MHIITCAVCIFMISILLVQHTFLSERQKGKILRGGAGRDPSADTTNMGNHTGMRMSSSASAKILAVSTSCPHHLTPLPRERRSGFPKQNIGHLSQAGGEGRNLSSSYAGGSHSRSFASSPLPLRRWRPPPPPLAILTALPPTRVPSENVNAPPPCHDIPDLRTLSPPVLSRKLHSSRSSLVIRV